MLRYEPATKDDEEVEERIKALAAKHPRYGSPRIWALLWREGRVINPKRVHRLWKKLGLQVRRRRKKKKIITGQGVPLKAQHPNHVWTWDFIHDTTSDGRSLKSLTMSDEFTREGLAIETQRRLPAAAAVAVLDKVISEHGAPEFLRSDNGPEFIAKKLKAYLQAKGITTYYIEPGCPWQNGFGESFNGKFRDECLNMELYYSAAEAQVVHEKYRRAFNGERPHSSLNYQTPEEFKRQWEGAQVGTLPPHPRSLSRSCQTGAGEKQKRKTAARSGRSRDRLGPCVGARGRSPALPLSSAQAAGQGSRCAVIVNPGRRD